MDFVPYLGVLAIRTALPAEEETREIILVNIGLIRLGSGVGLVQGCEHRYTQTAREPRRRVRFVL